MASFEKKLVHTCSFFGFMTILLGTVLFCTFPSSAELTQGFYTPIIAFEFAKNEADLGFLTGNTDAAILNRDKMDAGHFWDMFFPFAYGGFMLLLIMKLKRLNSVILWGGIFSAVLIIPFDIRENLILIDITHALRNSLDVNIYLSSLDVATWFKWGALGMSIFLFSIGLIMNQNVIVSVFGFLTALSIFLCWLTDAMPILAEIMSVFVLLFFLIFAVHSLFCSWALFREGELPLKK